MLASIRMDKEWLCAQALHLAVRSGVSQDGDLEQDHAKMSMRTGSSLAAS